MRLRYETAYSELAGEIMLPALDEDHPLVVKEWVTRFRLFALTGRCPCGAACTINRDPPDGNVFGVLIKPHQRICPLNEPNRDALLERYQIA